MTTLIVRPKNKKELLMIENVLSALKVNFAHSEINKSYDLEFVNRILETKKQESFKIDPRNVWQSIQ
jgi:hypothetical protein